MFFLCIELNHILTSKITLYIIILKSNANESKYIANLRQRESHKLYLSQ